MKELTRLELAEKYNKTLPPRIREYLNQRGILDTVIDHHLLGWDGFRITIPIFSAENELLYFKLAKDPEGRADSPKMLVPPGGRAELYGWERVLAPRSEVIICEGEFDRLVLESRGLPAVTSTAGAGTFRPEWAEFFEAIKHVFICFDNDEAGRMGAISVGRLIPHAMIVSLPAEVGEGGDVTDFFVRLGKRVADFVNLLKQAKPAPPAPEVLRHERRAFDPDPAFRERIDRIKEGVSIESVIDRYVTLRRSGDSLIGLCPFHGELRPSLTVYPQRRNFYCYGCRKHGDVITFVQEIDNLSFGQTLDLLERFLPSSHEPESTQDNR